MRSKELKRPETDWVLLAMTLFEATAFILLAFRDGFDFVPLILAVSVPLLLVAQVLLLGRAYPHMDSYILIIVNFLCGVGLIMLYRLDAGRALRQLLFYGVGVMAMMAMTFLVARYRGWRKLRLLIMLASVAMLGLTLLIGEENGGAKNWIDLGFLSIQPSEFVKVALVLCLAMDLSERRTVRQLVPVGLFAVACVGLIVLQKDLGAVLICFLTCLTVYYVATSNWMLVLAGLVCAAAGSTVLYHLFDHVRTRVAIWQNPWDSPQGSGYQIIQSLISIASGGLTGMGLGLGSPDIVPVAESDFIFSAICEEFGILVGLILILLYVILFARGLLLAMRARSSFHALLAVGAVTSLALQTFMIVGGVIKMIPLTGVTLPFVSYGGSSMLSSMLMLGILQGVSISVGEQDESQWRMARRREEVPEL